MAFDRYETLTKHYTNEIQKWDWALIKKLALENCFVNEDQDSVYGQTWLGSQLGLYPSGKIYAFWTSNQTKSDGTRDECFMEALEAVAYSKDMYIDFSDDGIFACTHVNELSEVKMWISDEAQEIGSEILGA